MPHKLPPAPEGQRNADNLLSRQQSGWWRPSCTHDTRVAVQWRKAHTAGWHGAPGRKLCRVHWHKCTRPWSAHLAVRAGEILAFGGWSAGASQLKATVLRGVDICRSTAWKRGHSHLRRRQRLLHWLGLLVLLSLGLRDLRGNRRRHRVIWRGCPSPRLLRRGRGRGCRQRRRLRRLRCRWRGSCWRSGRGRSLRSCLCSRPCGLRHNT
mmetsp:Transcript_6760/g.12497  ORF Transcript_6760/g.12497 Transcript_6760/m.12497 type:complete len:209 (+) Transcript_6760:275-901(+)